MSKHALKTELLRTYRYRIELHAHTAPVSSCSEISPELMAEIYAREGYDAVVITNHFLYSSSDKFAYIDEYMNGYEQTKKAGEKFGLSVFLGAEIRFTENYNDYLLYGVDRKMLEDIYDLLPYGLSEFRKNYPLGNSVLIHAHPFRDGMTEVSSSLLDGIEVFNMHPGHNSRIAIASKNARRSAISLITAGSDFHHLNRDHEAGASLRSSVLPRDSFELATLLKSEDYLLEIGKNNLIIP